MGKKFLIGFVLFLLFIPTGLASLKSFIVEETDLVTINPTAHDPDQDNVRFYYSYPFNKSGAWKTGYEDAGEYNVKIRASDGQNITVENVLVIVKNKNRPPVSLIKKIEVSETDKISLKKYFVDPDGDKLIFKFSKPFNEDGIWQTGYSDSGVYKIPIKVSDGYIEITERITIIISESNEPPKIIALFSNDTIIKTKEDTIFNLSVKAIDTESNILTYHWILDNKSIGTTPNLQYYFDFESSGEHTLKLIIYDGFKETIRDWIFNVKAVNRAPELNLLPVMVKENDILNLDLPKVDLDGDKITYDFIGPFDEHGTWRPDYNSSGKYTFLVIADDGQFKTKSNISVTVVDVDRAPTLQIPNEIIIDEGKTITFPIISLDPDDDDIKITFDNAPKESNFNNGTFTWTPNYNTIKRSGGFISNILNTIRLEHLIIKEKIIPLIIKSCGKEKCTQKTLNIKINNVNRGPSLEINPNATFTETEIAKLNPISYDPDGDIIHYYYTEPLEKGVWKTNYEDSGEYTIYLTATDGYKGNTKPVKLTILNKNRKPQLEIKDKEIIINEEQEFTMHITSIDPDGDYLILDIKNLPEGARLNDGVFVWKPSFDFVDYKTNSLKNRIVSKNKYLNKKYNSNRITINLEFTLTDGKEIISTNIPVTVVNVNREPIITNYTGVDSALINEPVTFSIKGIDPDDDLLNYSWKFGPGEPIAKGKSINRIFVTPGKKEVTAIIDDGTKSTKKTWKVNVFDVKEEIKEKVPQIEGKFHVYILEG